MQKKNKVKAMAIIGAMALSLSGIGAYAYFSGTADRVENTFSIAEGEQNKAQAGTIKEAMWDHDLEENPTDTDGDGIPDIHDNLQPGATINKDPLLLSNVNYESWAFIKVEIPTAMARTAADTEDKCYDTVTFTPNPGWTLIKSTPSTTAGTNSEYIYGYDTKLAQNGVTGDQTTTLFDTISVPDFTKIGEVNSSVDISGALIQTQGYATQADAAAALGLN